MRGINLGSCANTSMPPMLGMRSIEQHEPRLRLLHHCACPACRRWPPTRCSLRSRAPDGSPRGIDSSSSITTTSTARFVCAGVIWFSPGSHKLLSRFGAKPGENAAATGYKKERQRRTPATKLVAGQAADGATTARWQAAYFITHGSAVGWCVGRNTAGLFRLEAYWHLFTQRFAVYPEELGALAMCPKLFEGGGDSPRLSMRASCPAPDGSEPGASCPRTGGRRFD